MDTGLRIKLVREHRGLTQQKLGEMLGYGKSSANRIAQYEMGYRSPKANRLKEIAKAMNIREEIFLMPDETPIDLLRILKDPMQYELFYETVGCVGSFIVCNLLLRWAFIVLSELDRNGTQKNKSAKNNNIIS